MILMAASTGHVLCVKPSYHHHLYLNLPLPLLIVGQHQQLPIKLPMLF
jgi:hypothetical protein